MRPEWREALNFQPNHQREEEMLENQKSVENINSTGPKG